MKVSNLLMILLVLMTSIHAKELKLLSHQEAREMYLESLQTGHVIHPYGLVQNKYLNCDYYALDGSNDIIPTVLQFRGMGIKSEKTAILKDNQNRIELEINPDGDDLNPRYNAYYNWDGPFITLNFSVTYFEEIIIEESLYDPKSVYQYNIPSITHYINQDHKKWKTLGYHYCGQTDAFITRSGIDYNINNPISTKKKWSEMDELEKFELRNYHFSYDP